jgi:uncharacterized protein (TIGR02145 family)
MKKTIYSLLTLVTGLVLSAGTCSGPDPVPNLATSITITSSPSPLNLTVGGTGTVTAKVLPATANQGIKWTVSPSGIVSVSTSGAVQAIAPGNATITATAQDGSGVTKSCNVNVAAAPVPVTSITITSSPSPLNLTVGGTGTVTANVLPATANQGVTWTVSPSGIVSVSTSGAVQAIAPGNATITATAQDGSGVSAAYDVNVAPVPVTGITLHLTATTRAPGATFTIVATVLPATATDKSVLWTSDDPGVADVDPNTGLITVKSTATAPLTCTITATTVSESKVATCEVTVARNLSTADPGWGVSLGTITHGTDGTERTIGTQTWSDVVIADACNKDTWSPGSFSNVNADGIRPSNSTVSPGTYFTWAAVVRYQDELCPAPWRVPTKDDFQTLFEFLGGTGTTGGSFPDVRDKLHNDTGIWAGAYGGSCGSDGLLSNQESFAYYWSQSEASATNEYHLFFSSVGNVYPQGMYGKSHGFLLRCVR